MTIAGLQNNGGNRRPMKEKVYRESGSDFIGKLNVLGSTDYGSVSNRIISTINVEPSAFPGTRLSVMAGLYERYRFRKFNLRYVPAVPNTLACQILWYFDTDPRDDPTAVTDANALIRQALAHTGGQQWNFNRPKVSSLPQRIDDQWYYTDENSGDNVRFTRQAIGRMLQVTQLVDFNGVAPTGNIEAGSLFIDWDCEFQLPQIDADVVTRSLGGPAAPPPTVFVPVQFDMSEFGASDNGITVASEEEILEATNVVPQDTRIQITGSTGVSVNTIPTLTAVLQVDDGQLPNPTVYSKWTLIYSEFGEVDFAPDQEAKVPAGSNMRIVWSADKNATFLSGTLEYQRIQGNLL